jgi:hypothetical protein
VDDLVVFVAEVVDGESLGRRDVGYGLSLGREDKDVLAGDSVCSTFARQGQWGCVLPRLRRTAVLATRGSEGFVS